MKLSRAKRIRDFVADVVGGIGIALFAYLFYIVRSWRRRKTQGQMMAR